MINNLKYDKVNEVIDNALKFGSNYNLAIPIRYPQSVVANILRKGNKYTNMVMAGITCLWDTIDSYIIIKRKYINYYKENINPNKLEYSTASGRHFTKHDVKVSFFMLKCSIIKIIS